DREVAVALPLLGGPQQGREQALLRRAEVARLQVIARRAAEVGVGVEAPVPLFGQHLRRVAPALARFEERDEVVRDRRPALSQRRVVEGAAQAALDGGSRLQLERRQLYGQRVALGEGSHQARSEEHTSELQSREN